MSDVFLTPRQIYDELKGGPGSDSLGNAQRTSYDEARRESERAERITRIGRTIQAGWQGSAAEGAYGAAAPLADAALRGTDDLYRAQDLLDRQSGSFQRASNSVVEVSDDLPEMEIGDVLNPVDYEKQVRAHQADAEHNMQVFEGYDNASSHNETYAPREYPIISHSGGTVSVTASDTAGAGEPGPGRNGGDTGGSGGPGGGGPNGGGGGSSGGAPPGGTPGPGGQSPEGGQLPSGGGQQTRPNDYVPPTVAPPAGYQPSGLQPGPSTGTTGGFPGGVPVGGYPGGGPGSGGGAGSGGGRGGGAPGAGPRGGGGLGAGGGAGAATPGEGARAGGVGGVAGARGAGGPGAMGAAPMGGGRGKNDDESEHERKYLVEPDPEEMFGSEVLTAPQVIGDDEYEDD